MFRAKKTVLSLYSALVRFHLEKYGISVLGTILYGACSKLKCFQKRWTKMVKGLETQTLWRTGMLSMFSLEKKRLRDDSKAIYKLFDGLSHGRWSKLFSAVLEDMKNKIRTKSGGNEFWLNIRKNFPTVLMEGLCWKAGLSYFGLFEQRLVFH